jgi:hypothetical protein
MCRHCEALFACCWLFGEFERPAATQVARCGCCRACRHKSQPGPLCGSVITTSASLLKKAPQMLGRRLGGALRLLSRLQALP